MNPPDKKPAYFIDIDNEIMFLTMLVELEDESLEELENMYINIKDDKAGTHLSNNARKLTYEEMSYANLRYLIIGCQRAGAEIRVKALVAFLYRCNSQERLNKLVTNARLAEMMHKSLERNIETIYKWSQVKYKG